MKKRIHKVIGIKGYIARLAGLWVLLLLLSSSLHAEVKVIAGQDYAHNYETWAGNGGFGFGEWNLWSDGDDSGHFLGNSTVDGHGDINSPDGRSFGMFGHSDEYAHAQRSFAEWGDGYTFSIDIAVQWRDGTRGISLFNQDGFAEADEIWNFNIVDGDDGYGDTDFAYAEDMVLSFAFTQQVGDIQVRVSASNSIDDWTTTLENETLGGFELYTGGNIGDEGERNLYFNNLLITTAEESYVLNNDVTIPSLLIPEETILNAGSVNITVEEDGFFENNGTFNAGEGTVTFLFNTEVRGLEETVFYNVEVSAGDGNSVDFGTGNTRVTNHLILESGFVENAPTLEENSTLIYRTDGNYNRAVEWNNPWHVNLEVETNLNLNISDFEDDLVVMGNLTIDESSAASVDAGHSHDFVVEGDVILNGTLSLFAECCSDLQVGGHWTLSATGVFNPNDREVIFNGNQQQDIQGETTFDYLRINNPDGEVVLGDGITVNERLEVDAGALLNMETQLITGGGTFELQQDGALKIGHPDGINQTGEEGNIQLTGVRTFAAQATYHYVGSENQSSGNALPLAEADKIIIVELADNANELTLDAGDSGAIEIGEGGRLEIRSGTLLETPQSIAGVSRRIEGDGELIMTGGQYLITSVGKETHKPRLQGDYKMTGGAVVFAAEGEQLLRGGKDYHDLIFRGETETAVSTATPNISGTVFIHVNARVEAGSSTFGSSATNLTMTGGYLVMEGSRPLPDMEGDYDLTGGTLVYGGDGQSHRIRGPREYMNIDIKGDVKNPGGNVTIKEGGIFQILSDATFRITNRAIVGEGTFIMEDNSTLLYGNLSGITDEEGQDSDEGNIRTSSRSFNSSAYYGFIGNASGNQVTGSGLPLTVWGIILDKGGEDKTVTLSNDLQIFEFLELNKGILVPNGHELYLSGSNADALVEGEDNPDFTVSYINGAFTRGVAANDTDYIFPVGRDSGVQTATLRFSELVEGSNPTVTARFRTDMPGNYYGNLPQTFDGVLINTLSDEGFWQIDGDGQTSYPFYDLSLLARDFGGVNNPEGIHIVKRDNGEDDWELDGDASSYSGDEFNYVFTRSNLSDFSEFALGGNINNNPLPVEWLGFDARKEGGRVELTWQTATETNNDYFTVLRSTDGLSFSSLTYMEGAGNSNRPLSYSYSDNTPLPGVNYYKIKQTDFDGTTDYSHIVAVEVHQEERQDDVVVFEHDQHILFHLPGSSHSGWTYRVFSLSGQLLTSGSIPAIPGGNQYKVDVSPYNGQLLLVSITGNNQVVRVKVLVRD